MHTYRYGEILCTAAVLVKIYHVLQGYDSQLERTIYFLMECNCQICPTIIREANEHMVVGGPNSTDEGMNKINAGGKSRESVPLTLWPAKRYRRGNISYTQR